MGSRGIKAILATVGVLTLASVGQAMPAAAALTPTLYGFGSNQWGELGNGTTTASLSPTPVAGLPSTVRQLATGLESAAAVMSDGSLWTWGSNYYHQLGYGSSASVVSTPRQVPGLSGVTQVALSDEGNGYAVESDGSVWAWGDNTHAQLGNGTTTPSYSPVRLPILTGITQVASDGWATMAVAGTTMRVWAWGDNTCGELGDGTTASKLSPEPIGLVGVTQVVMGQSFLLDTYSAAVRSDGTRGPGAATPSASSATALSPERSIPRRRSPAWPRSASSRSETTATASSTRAPTAWSSARSRPRCLICTATASPRQARP
jgi:Regulator of chromosome condensation (RCC1) repeat